MTRTGDIAGGTPRQPFVMMLITTLTFGGAETQVTRLALELKARGWRVAVTCMVKPNAYVSMLTSEGIPVYSLDMPRGLPDPRAIGRLRRLLRELRPDVVHCHMVHANLFGRITRLFCRFPVLVCTAHNYRETSESGGPTWHKELLYRVTDFLADRTTIISQAAFDRYVRVGAVPRDRLELIPNGVDTEMFAPSAEMRRRGRSALGLGDNEFAWLAVGRLVEQKDYPNLFGALALILDLPWTLLIAGQGPLAATLEEMSRAMGLSTRVRFLGAREDILDLYNAADAYVQSSSFEGLSAALLEASCVGLPAAVTDVGGNRDVVLEGASGFIVPPGASTQLAAAMRRILEASPEARQAFGAAARQHGAEHFRFELIVAQWIRLYERLLNTKARTRNRGWRQAAAPALPQGSGSE